MSDHIEKTIDELVPRGPIESEPFKFRGKEAVWRVLDQRQTSSCRVHGMKQASDELMEAMGLDRKDALEVLQVGDAAENNREWLECYILGAAMRTPSGDFMAGGSPHDVAQWMADEITTIERMSLVVKYLEFADEHDPATITTEVVAEIIAALGKSGDPSILRPLGSNSLRSLAHSMALRLAVAESALEEMEEKTGLMDRVEALELLVSQTGKSGDGSN